MATSHVEQTIASVGLRLRDERHPEALPVLGVSGRLASGSEGEPVIRIEIVLDDPPAEQFGWDPYDLFTLRQIVRKILAELDDDLPPALIEFVPRTPDVDEDGDDDGLAAALDAPDRP